MYNNEKTNIATKHSQLMNKTIQLYNSTNPFDNEEEKSNLSLGIEENVTIVLSVIFIIFVLAVMTRYMQVCGYIYNYKHIFEISDKGKTTLWTNCIRS